MNVHLITLGCAKNQVDSEFIAGGLAGPGIAFTQNVTEAEAIIINTCGFIESAKEESIDTILEAVQRKKDGACERVIVTGCLSERYGDDLRASIPELDGIYGNRDLKKIVKEIGQELHLRRELIGSRQLISPRHYAYLKISEGCEHPCTFCAIPGIRGNFRGKPIDDLVAEARNLAAGGVRELVLIAQDSTQYGLDVYGKQRLPELLRELALVDGVEWIRLMYAYPYNVTDELIETIASVPQVCNYLDMPIQHTSPKMLKRMARRMPGDRQRALIDRLRHEIPGLVLRTSVIVGFPGETDADFEMLYADVAAGEFDRLGVFTYSREEGTSAAEFGDQVDAATMRERQALLIEAQDAVSESRNAALLGEELRVLVDEFDKEGKTFRARTAGDCPEVDQSVLIREPCRPGEFCRVRVTDAGAHDLHATLIEREHGGIPGSGRGAPLHIPVIS